jgi:serine/threonine-protein kinase
VPNLSGLTVEKASTVLAEVGLNLGAQTPESSDRPKGTIIAQQPASGDAIQRGQSVNVTISSGLEQISVPALVALSSADAARQALNDAGLNLGAVVEQPSTQPAGYVLAQDPAAGAQVDSGSAVNITVSSGQVTVPNVVGASEAQARSDLAQAGFDTQVVVLTDSTALGGTVLAQSPQAGQTLARGSVVTISVAASPQPTAEPGPVTTASPPPVDPAAPASPSPSKP